MTIEEQINIIKEFNRYPTITDKELRKIAIDNLIRENKLKLESTDYQAIKYAEGQLSEEEYAPIKVQRQKWRDEINCLTNE